jgi:uncharacterized protein (TIGR02145 family)
LDFARSSVYRIYRQGIPVGEICQEYLCDDGTVNSQAIVLYNYSDVKQHAQWERGLVCRLIDKEGKVHCGNVIWGESSALTYVEGTNSAAEYIYLNKENVLTPVISGIPAADAALPITIRPFELEDVRGDETAIYPVVKIGTQYWLRSNLRTTRYNDEKQSGSIESVSTFTAANKPCMAVHAAPVMQCYYNTAAVNGGALAPVGWRISRQKDWDELVKYINGGKEGDDEQASALKAGALWGDATNISGFNGYMTGYYNETLTYPDARTMYWSVDDDGNAVAGRALYKGRTSVGNVTDFITSPKYAAVIRCVKE